MVSQLVLLLGSVFLSCERMLVLNVLPRPTEADQQNKVFYLETLGKKRILAEVENSIIYPNWYVIALASPVWAEQPIEAKDLVTTSEWLDVKGVSLTTRDRKVFEMTVSSLFIEEYGARPRIVTRPDDKGRWIKKANGFTRDQLGVLEAALKTVTSSRKA